MRFRNVMLIAVLSLLCWAALGLSVIWDNTPEGIQLLGALLGPAAPIGGIFVANAIKTRLLYGVPAWWPWRDEWWEHFNAEASPGQKR